MATEKRDRQRQARIERRERETKAQKQKARIRRGIIVAVVAVVVVGSIYVFSHRSTSTPATTTTTSAAAAGSTMSPAEITAAQNKANKISEAAGCPASPTTRVNNLTWPSAPAMTINTAATYTATITTDLGPMVVTLNAKSDPITVNNFVFLAQKGYYHCVVFHRVIPQFMDQTGDPTGTGTGGPGYTITDENPPKASNPNAQYPLGSLAMANTGQPNTGGSQFFIVTGAEGEALPNSYALFGVVTSGMNVAEKINAQGTTKNNGVPPLVTHRILSVTIATS